MRKAKKVIELILVISFLLFCRDIAKSKQNKPDFPEKLVAEVANSEKAAFKIYDRIYFAKPGEALIGLEGQTIPGYSKLKLKEIKSDYVILENVDKLNKYLIKRHREDIKGNKLIEAPLDIDNMMLYEMLEYIFLKADFPYTYEKLTGIELFKSWVSARTEHLVEAEALLKLTLDPKYLFYEVDDLGIYYIKEIKPLGEKRVINKIIPWDCVYDEKFKTFWAEVFWKTGGIPYTLDTDGQDHVVCFDISEGRIDIDKLLPIMFNDHSFLYEVDDDGVYHIKKKFPSAYGKTLNQYYSEKGILKYNPAEPDYAVLSDTKSLGFDQKDTWIPSKIDIIKGRLSNYNYLNEYLEKGEDKWVKESIAEIFKHSYKMQVIGLIEKGRKVIYYSYIGKDFGAFSDFKDKWINGLDGWYMFWRIKYDVEKDKSFDLNINPKA